MNGEQDVKKSMFPLRPQLPLGDGQSGQSMMRGKRLWLHYPDDIHRTLKVICQQQGLTLDQLVSNMIIDYVRKESESLFKTVNISNIVVADNVTIYQMIFEEEVSQLCKAVKDAVGRKAPGLFLNELREKLLKTLKQNPNLSPRLAEEAKAALALLRMAK